jgi:Flp pilus assembly protein TadD
MLRIKSLFGQRSLVRQIIFLFLSAIYLFAFPQPNIEYPIVVLLHAFIGLIATILMLVLGWRLLKISSFAGRIGWVLLFAGGIIGCVLIKVGTISTETRVLYSHIILCLAGTGILFADWLGRRGWLGRGVIWGFARTTICLLLLSGLGWGAWTVRNSLWLYRARIQNPSDSPATMNTEGDGANGPFFPSSAQVYGNQKIPSEFFMQSDSCKRCHAEIYKEWSSSAHHFSSFNNQWYRKSIEYMQDTIGTKPSKWCGGCHDPAVLYAGKMDRPIKEFVHSPEAQAGLGCMMCHSIAKVKSTMGQADFYLEYPKLHELAASKNPFVRTMHDFLVYLNPEPHRRVFLKPFMRNQTAQFCSTCHKVHLDVPVNHYRWVRGFNEYDNWQASGVSGFGARSFYYPPKSMQCADCHMPLTRSTDMGNVNGFIHSHRFPAANTALPTANDDAKQLQVTEDFLKSGIVSIDIFALSPEQGKIKSVAYSQAETSTTFAVGEEAESKIANASPEELAPVTAPLNRVQPVVRRGDTVRVDVVVRTKGVGHFFPGGTVDAFDCWVALKATDDKGQTIFWSGQVEDNGHGPVEPGAHFYKSLQVDEHGNVINKRNAWATRSVVYVHLIPPGAADTVHYRLYIPKGTGNKVHLEARLLYRKFSWWTTQFAFAGVPDPNEAAEVTPDYDDRKFEFTSPLKGLSAKEQKIPDLPIVTIAKDDVDLNVEAQNAPVPAPKVDLVAADWHRWNDYGIGLLLQGDLKGAQAAFVKATQIAPKNPDGWVNIGRAAVQEGDLDQAQTVLDKALGLSPKLARAHYFESRVLRSEGKYDAAEKELRIVLAQYPQDRVVLNDLGRVLFLQRRYADAVKVLGRVLAIDPEDLEAHYNLMLCYNGLGDTKDAHAHEVRYLRFKANEAAQTITGPYRAAHPEDNNERQAIHEHVSIPLPILTKAGVFTTASWHTGKSPYMRAAAKTKKAARRVSSVRVHRRPAGGNSIAATATSGMSE